MKQIRTLSDERLDGFCSYCGKKPETRDHVPSKVLLDKPFPENLPIVPACKKCNEDLSLDEEYFACLIECILCGTTEIDKLKREKIRKILSKKPKLHLRLSKAQKQIDGNISFETEETRIRNVILKLARGHVKYENSEINLESPSFYSVKPLVSMNKEEMEDYFLLENNTLLPEIGSRSFQRGIQRNGNFSTNWIVVQENNYRYFYTDLTVKFIIWEYLACEVGWN